LIIKIIKIIKIFTTSLQTFAIETLTSMFHKFDFGTNMTESEWVECFQNRHLVFGPTLPSLSYERLFEPYLHTHSLLPLTTSRQ
jgi:hypothetical protein